MSKTIADEIEQEVAKRRTFAIISHPDAGKTTLTEKLLLFGGAIRVAGSVKARKASRHATSRLDGNREAAGHFRHVFASCSSITAGTASTYWIRRVTKISAKTRTGR